ncbi:hypothetical protein N657DRAFT_137579 [Parathielavia appendiculata]|uniref:Uncharacterized protein n=1 Tax=Parathielavia appendiculata TaxID=2587402 RepID=A0AAN6Z135_9PEZI|nr:hypothetical protein N657DRAFT_137579 [Parathielavia appendiculata]
MSGLYHPSSARGRRTMWPPSSTNPMKTSMSASWREHLSGVAAGGLSACLGLFHRHHSFVANMHTASHSQGHKPPGCAIWRPAFPRIPPLKETSRIARSYTASGFF